MKSVKIADYITWQKMNDYVYIIDERNRELFFIDELGMDIWLTLEKSCIIVEIIEYISNKYRASNYNNLSEIVLSFIKKLLKAGFIHEYSY